MCLNFTVSFSSHTVLTPDMRKDLGQSGALTKKCHRGRSSRGKEAAQAKTGGHRGESVCRLGTRRMNRAGVGRCHDRGCHPEKETITGGRLPPPLKVGIRIVRTDHP